MSQTIDYDRIPAEARERWALVRAVVAGDQAMSKGGFLPYLNNADLSQENKARNEAYIERAVFYGATGRTQDGLMGIAYRKDPSRELPEYLQYLQTDADGAQNSIDQQSQAVAGSLLAVGRHGLMVDFDARLMHPVIKSYEAESIINWRYENNVLVLVVLREEVEEPDGYGLTLLTQYREMALKGSRCVCRLWRANADGAVQPYQVLDANTGELVDELVVRSQSKALDFIPFRFVGSRNNDAAIDPSPLYALARLNVAHYRNSADYEDSVFFVGQAQPWIAGLTEEWRDHLQAQKTAYIGSRAPFLLPAGGAFGFAQPSPNTLVYEAMEQKERQMVALGARLLDQTTKTTTATQNENDKEASTSVLSMCIANVNEAYQTAIGWCAVLLDKPLTTEAQQASYKINQDYSRANIDSQAITALVAAWQAGVIAKPDLRTYLRAEGIIAVERTDEVIDGDLEMQGPALGMMDEPLPFEPTDAPVIAPVVADTPAAPEPVDLSPVLDKIAELQTQLDAMTKPVPVTTLEATAAEPAPTVDLTPLSAQISAMSSQIAAIQNEPAKPTEPTAQIVADALKPLQDQISQLAARPVPVEVDQAALKAAISQDMAALVAAMQRPQQVVMLDSSGAVTRQIQINRDEAGNIIGASSTQG